MTSNEKENHRSMNQRKYRTLTPLTPKVRENSNLLNNASINVSNIASNFASNIASSIAGTLLASLKATSRGTLPETL